MDVRRRLGAREGTGTVLVVLFVPSTDRNGTPIDHVLWVTNALEVFGRLFRGATAYPRARGVWRDDARGGALLYDGPTIIQCYAERAALDIRSDRSQGFPAPDG
jgi:hypothetical protein